MALVYERTDLPRSFWLFVMWKFNSHICLFPFREAVFGIFPVVSDLEKAHVLRTDCFSYQKKIAVVFGTIRVLPYPPKLCFQINVHSQTPRAECCRAVPWDKDLLDFPRLFPLNNLVFSQFLPSWV